MSNDLEAGLEMLERIADGDFSALARDWASAVIDELNRRERRIVELDAQVVMLQSRLNTNVLDDDDRQWAQESARRLGFQKTVE